nr:S9 family peptidase [Alteromonas confluentis]
MSTAACAEALPDTLQYEDTFNLEYAASPFFSHDGNSVFYERRSMDIMKDRTHSTLWQVSVDGKRHRPVLANNANVRAATLSPDGNMLAYVSDQNGSNQIYVRYQDTGQIAKLTTVEFMPGNLTWSHDGKHVAFTLFTPTHDKPLFTGMPKKPKGAEWAETAKVIDTTSYRSDGRGYLPAGFNQIYILPVSGGTPRQLTTGAFPNDGKLDFSADDKRIFFSANRNTDYSLEPLTSDIFSVDVNSTEVTAVTSLPGPESSPTLSPNGKYLAFNQVEDNKMSYQNGDITVLELKSGTVTRLTSSLDRSVQQFEWNSDSDGLVFSYLDHGQTRLAEVNLKGKITTLKATLGGQSLGRPYTSGQFAVADNGTIAFTTDDPLRPADIAVTTKRGTSTLTDLNSDALAHLKLANVETMPVKSSVDGRDIDAWIALPPNFDKAKSYPLILEIHGGPHAAYGPHFAMEIQLMAAQGYVVVWSNPRGSSSYGADFGNLIHHNYPSEDYNDLMDVVDTAIGKGFIDEKNLFITGGSGGGVLTAWSVGKTNRFAAAVVAKPVINWISFGLTADAYPYFTEYWMPGKPWEAFDHLWAHSPLSLVGNVKTPTMLLTGESDYRTPISESEQFYQALRLQGVDAAMVRIPGASHGIASKPSRLIQKVGNIMAWFEKYRTKAE